MRRYLLIILASTSAIGLLAESARADSQRSLRKELKVNYAKIVKAFKNNDPSVWEGFLVPDFKLKLFNGSVQDRKWVVDYVRKNAKTFRVLKLNMTIQELSTEGEDATAVVKQESSRTFKDEQGQSHRLDVGALQRETWTKVPTGWMLKSVEEWKVLYLLKDGKPMTQQKAKPN